MSTIEFETEHEFILVHVHSPKIHENLGGGKYTTYQIELKTNSLSFTKKHSMVRRTYSEFFWLRKALVKTTARPPPSLRTESLFGRFNTENLSRNEAILTNFIQEVVKNTFFVSSAALHLFLQSNLSIEEMKGLIRQFNKNRGSMNSLVRARSFILSEHCSPEKSLVLKEPFRQTSINSSWSSSSTSITDKNYDSNFEWILMNKASNGFSSFSSSSTRNGFCTDLADSPSHSNSSSESENSDYQKSRSSTENSVDIAHIDSDYPKWLLAESPSKSSMNEHRKLSNPHISESRFSKSYTEVSWSLEHVRQVSKKFKSLALSPVRFSIGGNILLSSEPSSAFTSPQNLLKNRTQESQNFRKTVSCSNLPSHHNKSSQKLKSSFPDDF